MKVWAASIFFAALLAEKTFKNVCLHKFYIGPLLRIYAMLLHCGCWVAPPIEARRRKCRNADKISKILTTQAFDEAGEAPSDELIQTVIAESAVIGWRAEIVFVSVADKPGFIFFFVFAVSCPES